MTERVRIVVAGATGWVGKALVSAIEQAPDLALSGAVARSAAGEMAGSVRIVASLAEALTVPSDVVIDYTKPAAVLPHALEALEAGRHVIIGTSGLTAEQYEEIDTAAHKAGRGVLAAGNFSITATLLRRFALEAAKYVADVEVIDYASPKKIDTPSGTGRELAEMLSKVRLPATSTPIETLSGVKETRGGSIGTPVPVQVHSVRMPSFILSCEAIFGASDERLVIRHDAGSSAAPYIAGTLLAARRVHRFTGLRRGLDHVLD